MSATSLDKSKIKILLLEGIHPGAVDAFRADGYTGVEVHPKALAPAVLAASLRDAYFVGIRSATRLTAELLEQAPKLTAIGCFCIGTNQVDLEAAQARGIPVFNAPFSNTRSVAELVLAEIILLLRDIPQRNAAAHRGEWVKSAAGAPGAAASALIASSSSAWVRWARCRWSLIARRARSGSCARIAW